MWHQNTLLLLLYIKREKKSPYLSIDLKALLYPTIRVTVTATAEKHADLYKDFDTGKSKSC